MINSNLFVLQNVTFSNTLSNLGNASFSSNVSITSNLLVAQNVTFSNTLSNLGNASFSSNVLINSNLFVVQNATLCNTLSNLGNANFSSNVNIIGNLNFNGTLMKNNIPYIGSQWSNNSSNVFLLSSNVGIAKSNPAYQLDVGGDLNFDGILRKGGVPYIGSQWSNVASNVFLMGSNVAIGKSNAGYTLDVAGSVNFAGGLFSNGTPFSTGVGWTSNNIGIYTQSNVGIGMAPTDSSNILSVAGNISLDRGLLLRGIQISKNLGGLNNVSTTIQNIPGVSNTASNLLFYNGLYMSGIRLSAGNPLSSPNVYYSTSNLQGFTISGSNIILSIPSSNSTDAFRFKTGSLSNEVLTLTGKGWLGLGTSNPACPLHVVNGTSFIQNFYASDCFSMNQNTTLGNGGQMYIGLGKTNTSTNLYTLKYIHSNDNHTSNSLRIGYWTNDSVVTIMGNNTVGINTSNVASTLTVNGSILGGAYTDNTAFGFDSISNARFGIVKKLGVLPAIASSSNNPLIFGTLQSTDVFTSIQSSQFNEWMRISPSNGFIGIGTNSPNSLLAVAGGMMVGPQFSNAIAPANGLAIQGNVGIGTSNPGAQLDLSTDSARKLTSTAWATGSDQRVKRNIVDANLDLCYSNVKNLKLRRFQWDSNFYPDVDDRNVLGWIAQEVESVYPNAVFETDSHGISNFKNLQTDQVIKSMYGAVQGLISKVDPMQSNVAHIPSILSTISVIPSIQSDIACLPALQSNLSIIASLQSNFPIMQSNMTVLPTMQRNIADLQSNVAVLQSNAFILSSNQTNLALTSSNVQLSVSILQSHVAVLESNAFIVSSNQTSLATVSSNAQLSIYVLQSNVTNNQNSITILQSNVSYLQSNIAILPMMRNDITTLQSNMPVISTIPTMQSNIASLQTVMPTLQSNITMLQDIQEKAYVEYDPEFEVLTTLPEFSVAGVDQYGTITTKFSESLNFTVITENNRQAFAGRLRLSTTVLNAEAGDYLIPVLGPQDSILLNPVKNYRISFNDYRISIGKVIRIDNGRPIISIKVC